MTRFEESIHVPVPAAFLFDLVHDYSVRLNWDPFLRSVSMLDKDGRPLSSGSPVGVGSKVNCSAQWRSGGATMVVEYVSFHRPRTAAIRMLRGPWYFRSFTARMTTSAVSDTETVLTGLYQFETVMPMVVSPAVQLVFRTETIHRWKRLKFYAENSYRDSHLLDRGGSTG